ncbi:MAG: spermidine/putrescine ABC transporter substrate-binding protein [Clostridia bacterium]|nr:spermidine/putrescine ABC transporter substrate-binding protein [Clostridia bacterium]
MRKILASILTLTLIAALFTAVPALPAKAETVTINVYNWGQYIGVGEDGTIDVNAEFTKRTGIKVNYTTYDSNETMLTKLETGGSSYDIIIPSDYMIERLIKKDMLEKLDFSNIPNYKYIDDLYKNTSYDPNNEYSVPYTYGTVGIIYNTKYVTKPVDSWSILWDADYKDKILTFDNPRDLFAIAEFLLGIDVNTTDEADYESCYNKLLEQKPILQQYVMDQIFDAMINESAWIAPYYAGDFVTMHEDNPDLAFCYPKEGFNFFIDAICIPKGCEHKAEAEAYINFLCDPEISGRNMDAIGYATPIPEAKEYLSEEFANSDVVYFDEATAANSKMFADLPDATFQLMNDYWSKLKVGGSVTVDDDGTVNVEGRSYTVYIIIGAVIAAIIAAVVIIRMRKNKLYE